MRAPRVQSLASLRDEMIAVARGEREAPAHAAAPSVHSASLIARLLTPENRALMSVIRDSLPESVAQLAAMTGRAPSNLTRTLDKLAAVGLVTFKVAGRRKAPRTVAGKILIEIEPFSSDDSIHVSEQPYRGRSAAASESSRHGGKQRPSLSKREAVGTGAKHAGRYSAR
jgi:predicted transcriptional regulator